MFSKSVHAQNRRTAWSGALVAIYSWWSQWSRYLKNPKARHVWKYRAMLCIPNNTYSPTPMISTLFNNVHSRSWAFFSSSPCRCEALYSMSTCRFPEVDCDIMSNSSCRSFIRRVLDYRTDKYPRDMSTFPVLIVVSNSDIRAKASPSHLWVSMLAVMTRILVCSQPHPLSKSCRATSESIISQMIASPLNMSQE